MKEHPSHLGIHQSWFSFFFGLQMVRPRKWIGFTTRKEMLHEDTDAVGDDGAIRVEP
jgi:hypothetical protein